MASSFHGHAGGGDVKNDCGTLQSGSFGSAGVHGNSQDSRGGGGAPSGPQGGSQYDGESVLGALCYIMLYLDMKSPLGLFEVPDDCRFCPPIQGFMNFPDLVVWIVEPDVHVDC